MSTAVEAAATLLEANGHPYSADLLRRSMERGIALEGGKARVRELEAEAAHHREEVDELATELAEERTLTQELQAERDELRAALERIVHELDWGNEDGNIFPAAALRVARAALRSPAGPSTDEDKP